MQRPKLAVMVADAIAEEIFAKGLAPGVVLATESKMLGQFGVGRATLREALRLLEAIRMRDPAKAGDSMLKHITAHYDYLRSDYPFLLSTKVRLVGTS